jgi:hypothetical protein
MRLIPSNMERSHASPSGEAFKAGSAMANAPVPAHLRIDCCGVTAVPSKMIGGVGGAMPLRIASEQKGPG